MNRTTRLVISSAFAFLLSFCVGCDRPTRDEKPIPHEVLKQVTRDDGKLVVDFLVDGDATKEDVLKLAESLKQEYAGKYASMYIYGSREAWQRWNEVEARPATKPDPNNEAEQDRQRKAEALAEAGAEAEKMMKEEGLSENDKDFIRGHVYQGWAFNPSPLNVSQSLQDGDMGVPYYPSGVTGTRSRMGVEKIIGGDAMVVTWGNKLWLKGVSTAGLTDRSSIDLKGRVFFVNGFQTYTPRSGKEMTLPCLVAVDVPKVAAALECGEVKNWLSAKIAYRRAVAEEKRQKEEAAEKEADQENDHDRYCLVVIEAGTTGATSEVRWCPDFDVTTRAGTGANVGKVYVRGHYRNGRWVEPHYRNPPGAGPSQTTRPSTSHSTTGHSTGGHSKSGQSSSGKGSKGGRR
jgi:hypothetical protein